MKWFRNDLLMKRNLSRYETKKIIYLLIVSINSKINKVKQIKIKLKISGKLKDNGNVNNFRLAKIIQESR